ncbi:MAG: hypothetical protein KVP17_003292 [Porospora cf. gigantea B]|uniref:uncharacterized protein n=1 Tax=Porospora cf. gigantea B TaxID=2853592 RepID=UPI003571C714|nr:MAG: hypothetical protein KVP17_003292 [Porospora cf. gigantea B]
MRNFSSFSILLFLWTRPADGEATDQETTESQARYLLQRLAGDPLFLDRWNRSGRCWVMPELTPQEAQRIEKEDRAVLGALHAEDRPSVKVWQEGRPLLGAGGAPFAEGAQLFDFPFANMKVLVQEPVTYESFPLLLRVALVLCELYNMILTFTILSSLTVLLDSIFPLVPWF